VGVTARHGPRLDETSRWIVFFGSLFIIHTRVNVLSSPVLALAPCPPVLIFPYRILLCFLFVWLFLLLTRQPRFRDESPMLQLFVSSSNSCRRKVRVEVTSLSEHWSQMAAFAGNAGGYRKPLPTCRACMDGEISRMSLFCASSSRVRVCVCVYVCMYMCVYVCVCASVYVWDLKLHLQIQETSRSLFQKESKRVSDLYEQHGYGHFYESSLSCGGAVFADETKSEYYHSRTGHRKRYFDKDFFLAMKIFRLLCRWSNKKCTQYHFFCLSSY